MIRALFYIVFLTLCACSRPTKEELDITPLPIKSKMNLNFNDPEKIISFVDDENNGFVKSKRIGEITYISMLKPIDYLLAQKRLKDKNPNYKRDDFENLQYFDLRIKIEEFNSEFIKYKLEDAAQYQERINYCSFQMQDDIKLIEGSDTLNCVLFHYERAFDVTPYGHFLLGFENKKKSNIELQTLCFNDKLFNNGIIKFTYTPKFLAKEPILL